MLNSNIVHATVWSLRCPDRPAGIPNSIESLDCLALTLPYDASLDSQQNCRAANIPSLLYCIPIRVTGWDFTASGRTFGTTSRDLAGKYSVYPIRRPHNRTRCALPC